MNPPGIKQIDVQIMGQSYLLACPLDGETALQEAVDKVDAAMCRIRDAGKVKARDRIAVLAALNIAYELSQKDAVMAFNPSSFGNTEAGGAGHSVLPNDSGEQLEKLLAKLDAALTQDGSLL